MAVGPDGNLYVADSGNGRVQVVAPSGAFVRTWGSAGSGQGQFEQLWGIGVGGSGSVYTAETFFGSTGADRIQKFDPAGNYLLSWGSSSQFNSIIGLAVDAADNVYVADLGNGNSGRVQKFDSSGHLVAQWGSPGFAVGQFRGLSAIAVDTAGNVYTVEARDGPDPSANNNRVQKFDGEGHPKADFIDSEGNPTSTFPIENTTNAWVSGIAVDAAGYVYVVSGGGTGLTRFTPTGGLAEQVGCGQLAMRGVVADSDGKLYAAGSSGLDVFIEGGGACPNLNPGGGGGGGVGGGGGGVGAGASVGLTFHGTEGVTINAAAQFTNHPKVDLLIVPPGGVTQVHISNDGGFANATSLTPQASGHYPWVLESSGPERLPKTVYVRFAGPGPRAAAGESRWHVPGCGRHAAER